LVTITIMLLLLTSLTPDFNMLQHTDWKWHLLPHCNYVSRLE